LTLVSYAALRFDWFIDFAVFIAWSDDFGFDYKPHSNNCK